MLKLSVILLVVTNAQDFAGLSNFPHGNWTTGGYALVPTQDFEAKIYGPLMLHGEDFERVTEPQPAWTMVTAMGPNSENVTVAETANMQALWGTSWLRYNVEIEEKFDMRFTWRINSRAGYDKIMFFIAQNKESEFDMNRGSVIMARSGPKDNWDFVEKKDNPPANYSFYWRFWKDDQTRLEGILYRAQIVDFQINFPTPAPTRSPILPPTPTPSPTQAPSQSPTANKTSGISPAMQIPSLFLLFTTYSLLTPAIVGR